MYSMRVISVMTWKSDSKIGRSPITRIEVAAKKAKLLAKSIRTFLFQSAFSLKLNAMIKGIQHSQTFPKTENTSLRLCISRANKIVVPDAKKLMRKKGISITARVVPKIKMRKSEVTKAIPLSIKTVMSKVAKGTKRGNRASSIRFFP